MEAQGVGLDILAITLNKACELIVSGQETRFEFFGATNSLEWCKDYAERRASSKGEAADSDGSDGDSAASAFLTLKAV